MHHACEGAQSLFAVPKASMQFFRANRKGWEDWLGRMRPPLVTAAWRLLRADVDPIWLATLAPQRLRDLQTLLPTTSAADGPRVVRDLYRVVQRLSTPTCTRATDRAVLARLADASRLRSPITSCGARPSGRRRRAAWGRGAADQHHASASDIDARDVGTSHRANAIIGPKHPGACGSLRRAHHRPAPRSFPPSARGV